MPRRSWIFLAIIAVAPAVMAGWWFVGQVPSSAPTPALAESGTAPDNRELRLLQAEADAACLCARTRGDDPWHSGCWASFERHLARYEHSSMTSACGEESASLICFGGGDPMGPDADPDTCINRQREYSACSDAEVRARRAEARARSESGC